MIDPINWPPYTNADMKADILAGKVNEIIAALDSDHTEKSSDFPQGLAVVDVYDYNNAICLHANTRTLKNGRKFCNDCRKLVKG